MNDAQRDAALQEVKRLREMAADLAGQAESLEQALTADSDAAVAVDYAIGQSPPLEGVAAVLKDGKKAADWGSLAGQDLPNAILQGRKAEELLAEIVRVYSGFDRVRAIAVGQFAWEVQVFVLVEMDKQYDGEFIGSLIDAEFDLRRQFEPLCLAPSYDPVGKKIRRESTYRGAAIIWHRDAAVNE